jgi:hypothetical protein
MINLTKSSFYYERKPLKYNSTHIVTVDITW